MRLDWSVLGASSGCPKIARHFSGGFVPRIVSVPEARLKDLQTLSGVPPGRACIVRRDPALKRRADPKSLRDLACNAKLQLRDREPQFAGHTFPNSLAISHPRSRFRCNAIRACTRMRRLWRFLELEVNAGTVLEGSTREGSRLEAHSSKRKNPLIACLGRARVGNQWVYRFSLLTLLFSGVNEDTLTRGTPPCVRFYKTLPCGSDAQKLHKFC